MGRVPRYLTCFLRRVRCGFHESVGNAKAAIARLFGDNPEPPLKLHTKGRRPRTRPGIGTIDEGL